MIDPLRAKIPPVLIRISRRITGRYIKGSTAFRTYVQGKAGLEIGGPSGTFSDTGVLPLYRWVANLDNCVFSTETVWEGNRPEGYTFCFHPAQKNGYNFIRDATDLHDIVDAKYDFLLSAHNLEHIANPVKALKEWIRVVKPGGALIIILPHRLYTFDHRRPVTNVQHMLEDYARGTDERDMTHLPEVFKLHDLSRDPQAGSFEQFQQRCEINFHNRCLHHHVFDENNSRELLSAVGLLVKCVEFARPHHLALLAELPEWHTRKTLRNYSMSL